MPDTINEIRKALRGIEGVSEDFAESVIRRWEAYCNPGSFLQHYFGISDDISSVKWNTLPLSSVAVALEKSAETMGNANKIIRTVKRASRMLAWKKAAKLLEKEGLMLEYGAYEPHNWYKSARIHSANCDVTSTHLYWRCSCHRKLDFIITKYQARGIKYIREILDEWSGRAEERLRLAQLRSRKAAKKEIRNRTAQVVLRRRRGDTFVSIAKDLGISAAGANNCFQDCKRRVAWTVRRINTACLTGS